MVATGTGPTMLLVSNTASAHARSPGATGRSMTEIENACATSIRAARVMPGSGPESRGGVTRMPPMNAKMFAVAASAISPAWLRSSASSALACRAARGDTGGSSPSLHRGAVGARPGAPTRRAVEARPAQRGAGRRSVSSAALRQRRGSAHGPTPHSRRDAATRHAVHSQRALHRWQYGPLSRTEAQLPCRAARA